METTPVIKDNPSHNNYADETSDMLDFHPDYLTMVREALEAKRVREAKASTVKELLAADDIPSKVKELFASDDIPSKLKEFIAANGMPKGGNADSDLTETGWMPGEIDGIATDVWD